MEWSKDKYLISTEKSRLQPGVIHEFLAEAYWSRGIGRAVVEKSIANSVCFGLFAAHQQIGFARLITDKATFAYLSDVFVLKGHRGRGLGKWLMSAVMAYPSMAGMRRIILATADAHDLYASFGFKPLQNSEVFMEISGPSGRGSES